MKGVCEITYLYPPYKNKDGVVVQKYSFKDPEGYLGVAFAKGEDNLSVDDKCIISLRCYKGKWYAKHIEKVE